ncbi:MAG TPA: hypothetical protein VMV01_16815, partial [Planctomycetota bacterium]|nr:hypothetical protein [Planctomycetota bacterium]
MVARLALLLSLLLASQAAAQSPVAAAAHAPAAPQKWWVFLADKGCADAAAESAAVSALAEGFPARARARRALRRTEPGLVDARDLPVAARYLEQIEALGARVHVTSRWLNAVSVSADAGQLARIEALPFVTRTQPVARTVRPQLLHPAPAAAAAAGPADGGFYGWATDQVALVDLD